MKNTKTLGKSAKISDRRRQQFVIDLLNAPDRQLDGSDDYLFREYAEFFPTRERDVELLLLAPTHLKELRGQLWKRDLVQIQRRAVLGGLRDRLREVWHAEDDKVAEWRLFVLQREIYFATDVGNKKNKSLYPPSLRTPIGQAIDWIQRSIFLLRVCCNPECSRPYFVANRVQRKFCVECVSISQRAHKRKWWRENKGRQQSQPQDDQKAGKRISKKRRELVQRVPERDLRRFIDEVVNAPEERIDYLLKAYPKLFPFPWKTEQWKKAAEQMNVQHSPDNTMTFRRQEMRRSVEELRSGLQSIWKANDLSTARWRLLNLRYELRSWDPERFSRVGEEQLPPADQLIHQVLAWLQQNLHKLRTCRNTVCQTPFFIAERTRLYCEDVCSDRAQQKYKTRWWKQKGPGWRKARRQQETKSRKAMRKTTEKRAPSS